MSSFGSVSNAAEVPQSQDSERKRKLNYMPEMPSKRGTTSGHSKGNMKILAAWEGSVDLSFTVNSNLQNSSTAEFCALVLSS